MPKVVKLDKTDEKILAALVSDGRISNLELAEKIGLTPTPCARRVKMLEDSGVVTGYTAVVDVSKLGKSLIVMVAVHLDSHSSTTLEVFERRILDMPEVLEAYMITGSMEYLLKIAAEDLTSYSAFQRSKLLVIPHVITADSMFILRQVKRRSIAVDAG